tara:strand:- start:2422 stop:2904 length:483 start_codon:yes stop_codon:yes gene_type:complete
MPLIIEDGSIVPNADSYITVAEYETWIDGRDLVHTGHNQVATIEEHIRRATDYFEALNLKGVKSTQNQSLQFPRYGLWIDDYPINSNEIPPVLKKALYEITYADERGYGLFNTIARKTKREKVGDLEIEYTNNSSSYITAPSVAAYIAKLIMPKNQIIRI